MRVLIAIAVALSLVASVGTAEAKQRKHYKHYGHKHHSRVVPHLRRSYVGGHRMGYEPTAPHRDQTFWERVESGPANDATSPSAF
jgi:hypothetical protein